MVHVAQASSSVCRLFEGARQALLSFNSETQQVGNPGRSAEEEVPSQKCAPSDQLIKISRSAPAFPSSPSEGPNSLPDGHRQLPASQPEPLPAHHSRFPDRQSKAEQCAEVHTSKVARLPVEEERERMDRNGSPAPHRLSLDNTAKSKVSHATAASLVPSCGASQMEIETTARERAWAAGSMAEGELTQKLRLRLAELAATEAAERRAQVQRETQETRRNSPCALDRSQLDVDEECVSLSSLALLPAQPLPTLPGAISRDPRIYEMNSYSKKRA